MKRYAIVRGLSITSQKVAAYLPSNYKVIHTTKLQPYPGAERMDDVVVIEGVDRHGYTLESFIMPRLGSGMIGCEEIDLSHPIMKEIPV